MHYREFDGETEEGWAYRLLDKNRKPLSGPNWSRAVLASGEEVQFNGHEVLERVEFRDENNLLREPGKSECSIIAGGRCRIWRNHYQIYSFRYVELEKAALKLVHVLCKLRNFPVPIEGRNSCEALVGRLVYYREFPAKVLEFCGIEGKVLIGAHKVIGNFEPEPWADKQERPEREFRVDLLSPKIHWFR